MSSNNSKRLEGKTALITGGTSGIGLAAARLFVAEGSRVAVVGRRGAAAVAAELGPENLGLDCDLAKVSEVRAMTRRVRERFVSLDILFANAGIAFYRPLEEWTESDFDELFGVNVKGQFFTAQACAEFMRPGGVIIFTGSIAAKLGQPSMAIYAASKAPALVFAKSLSADLVGRGIRALCLTPGPVDTPIFSKGGLSPSEAQATLTRVAKRVPLGRAATPEEIAGAALFMASDASRFMLGAEVVVDGGKSQL